MNSNPLPRFRLQFPKSNTGCSLSRSGKSLPGGKVTHGHPEQPHKLLGFSKTPTPPWPLFQQSGNELTAEKLRRSRRAQAVLPGPLFGCSSFGDPGWKRALWGCKVHWQGLSPSACMCNQTPGPNRHVLTQLRAAPEPLQGHFHPHPAPHPWLRPPTQFHPSPVPPRPPRGSHSPPRSLLPGLCRITAAHQEAPRAPHRPPAPGTSRCPQHPTDPEPPVSP